MKKRGQALVEFVLLLPIILLLVLGVIDFGNIMISKIELEKTLSNIVNDYQKGSSIEAIKKEYQLSESELKIEKDNHDTTILLTHDVSIITPGLSAILKSPYTVSVERSIIYE